MEPDKKKVTAEIWVWNDYMYIGGAVEVLLLYSHRSYKYREVTDEDEKARVLISVGLGT